MNKLRCLCPELHQHAMLLQMLQLNSESQMHCMLKGFAYVAGHAATKGDTARLTECHYIHGNDRCGMLHMCLDKQEVWQCCTWHHVVTKHEASDSAGHDGHIWAPIAQAQHPGQLLLEVLVYHACEPSRAVQLSRLQELRVVRNCKWEQAVNANHCTQV